MLTVPYYRGWFDLYVYYGTIEDWLRHGGQVYDYLLPGTPYGFTYPPFAALCMLPMALVPRGAAVAGAFALNAAASVYVLRKLVPGWPPLVAVCLFVMLEPVRDTFSLGQVNLLLLALVLTDLRPHRVSGLGIGLAAAVKLTPALFIGSLLLARRWRAAATATAVAVAATGLGWLLAPGPSRRYWTAALWDTGRVGEPGYVSNQSLRGMLARLGDPGPHLLWPLLVLAVLGVWALRVHRAPDALTAFALTGAAACLISPVTWVHHLVWLLPALALARSAFAYVVLCSSVVWLWRFDASGITGFLGSNAYVWLTLWLLRRGGGPAERHLRRSGSQEAGSEARNDPRRCWAHLPGVSPHEIGSERPPWLVPTLATPRPPPPPSWPSPASASGPFHSDGRRSARTSPTSLRRRRQAGHRPPTDGGREAPCGHRTGGDGDAEVHPEERRRIRTAQESRMSYGAMFWLRWKRLYGS
jgi:alpha-1,2-mannosyltransferase